MSAALSDIRMQVMWTRLISIVEEQAQTLMRTAFSTTVRDAGDLAAAMFDPRGRMVAEAVTGTPGHLNSMAAGVRHFLDKFPVEGMADGDHFITNDPWLTSGHLHDITVISPVFHKGRIVAILGVCRSLTEPVWDGKAFQPRLMLPLSLSWDHRVVDGAAAARFNALLIQILGDFRRVLL